MAEGNDESLKELKSSYLQEAQQQLVDPDEYDEDIDEPDFWDILHERVFYYVVKTRLGLQLDLFQTFLSFLAVAAYVAGTYSEELANSTWMKVAEVTFAVAFTLDYLLHLYLAKDNRCSYLFSSQSLIDIIAIIPIISLLYPDAQVGFLRLLRGIRVLSVLRANRLFESEVDPSTALQRQLTLMGFTLLAFVFIAAGVIYSVDEMYDGEAFVKPTPYGPKLSFFDALYFLLITFTTVGYGDVYPILFVSKLVTIFLILLVLVILPRETAKISQIVEKTSAYDAAYIPSESSTHVLICGQASVHSLLRFLSEFYHEDHGEQTAHVVILMPDEPSSDIETMILNDPDYDERVQYVKGNPINDNDLMRAGASQALACCVLADPFTIHRQAADVDAILAAKSIALHCYSLKVFIQLLLASSKVHVDWVQWHQSISLNEVKLSLLAGAARCPGFGTLMCNLIMSTGDMDVEQEWQEDYCHGFGQELYCFAVSPIFIDWTFSEVVAEMYVSFALCAFAIVFPDGSIALNPAKHVITGNEKIYLLADSADDGEHISDPEYNLKSGLRPTSESILSSEIPLVLPDRYQDLTQSGPRRLVSVEEVGLTGHIIVCGNLHGIYAFLRTLRATSQQPVLLLHPEEPRKEPDWGDAMRLPNVFFCSGNAMQITDLKRAGAHVAESMVIIADYSGFFVSTTNRSVDSYAIFVANVTAEYFPSCRCVVEMIDESSMTQLNHAPDSSEPYSLWPQYASGGVYLCNMLDCLIAQCYYKGDLLEVMSALVGDKSETTEDAKSTQCIQEFELPAPYVDMKWSTVFMDLTLNRACVPLALLRCPEAYDYEDEDGEMVMCDNPLPFVFTNPRGDTLLASGDKVVAICLPASKAGLAMGTGGLANGGSAL